MRILIRVLEVPLGLGLIVLGAMGLFMAVDRIYDIYWLALPFALLGVASLAFGVVAIMHATVGALPSWIARRRKSVPSRPAA